MVRPRALAVLRLISSRRCRRLDGRGRWDRARRGESWRCGGPASGGRVDPGRLRGRPAASHH